MNLRWLWFDHIPPELEVPKEARGAVRQRARVIWWLPANRRNRDVTFILGMAFVATGFAVAWCLLHFTEFRIGIVYAVISGGIPVIGAEWLRGCLKVRARRAALCEFGYLCCVKCGYVHTGLSKDVKECPECGAAREFGKCIHCNSPQDWPMTPQDKCTQCGRMRLS